MRQWLEAGYFKGDLPISQQPGGPFHQLSTLFPDLSIAFRAPESSSEADAASAAAREEEQRAKEEEERLAEEQARVEAERRREAELREHEAQQAAEAQKAAAIAEAEVKARTEEKNSSAQLKMMLGLGGGQQEERTEEPPLIEEPKPQQKKSQKQRSQPVPAPAPVPPAVPAKAAWGRSSSAGPRKSMSEIQQEEARQAASLAMERQATGRSSSSGWANVAASRGGSTGWQGGAVAQVAQPAGATGPNNATRMMQPPAQPKPAAAQRQVSAPATMQQKQRPSSTQQQHPADDFGASMSPALEAWCKDQMSKLNGSDDLTLVSFCMTLTDPHEIRQYLTAYLGSTPQVNNFATEFINKRGLGKNQQEEWESTKPKKSKKKGGK